jgi:anti-anti-sigma factor
VGAAPHWDATVIPLLHPPCPQTLDVDLAAVDFIDSSGLGMLVKLRAWAEPNSVRLRLVNVPRNVMRVLDFSGVTGLFVVSEKSAAELEPD